MSGADDILVLEPTPELPRVLRVYVGQGHHKVVTAQLEAPAAEHRALASGHATLARCHVYRQADGECSFWVGSTRFEVTPAEAERIGAHLGIEVEAVEAMDPEG